jgi:hypothetical protein
MRALSRPAACLLSLGAAAVLACKSDLVNQGGRLYSPLTINGDVGSTLGVWHPSLVYPAGATQGFLAYTSVPGEAAVHTRLAVSSDSGRTWVFLTTVNQADPLTAATTDTTLCGATACDGTWVHDNPSLVADPSDPDTTRRFKLFVHSYFVGTARSLAAPQYGTLSLYTAPHVIGPWSLESKALGWNSTSPVSSTGVGQNISTDAALGGLAGCYYLFDPGALVRGDTIDLALACVHLDAVYSTDIRLIRSTDHAASWHSVGTMLSTTDAGTVGSVSPQLSGADLFRVGTTIYLLATPQGVLSSGAVGNRGCLEFEVSDIETGAVRRDGGGGPVVLNGFFGTQGTLAGACTADAGATTSGILIAVAGPQYYPTFQILATGTGPP